MSVRLTDKIEPLNDAFTGMVDADQIVETPAGFKDEDNMVSDSATSFCSQQSIKKYVDDNAGGSGDVVGPAGATDDNIATFDTATGKLIQDGGNTVAEVLARTNHTGTQTASTVSDFDTEVGNHTDVTANTSARHTQNTDTALGSGAVAADHGTAATDQIINVCYGTGTAPTASTTTEGTLYVKYTA